MKKIITLSIITGIAFVFIAFTSTKSTSENSSIKIEELKGDKTIVDIAAGNENFTTLVAAVKAAELVEILNSKGPFTVFTPLNDAFSKLPKGTLESLLKAENKQTNINFYSYLPRDFREIYGCRCRKSYKC